MTETELYWQHTDLVTCPGSILPSPSVDGWMDGWQHTVILLFLLFLDLFVYGLHTMTYSE